jgi:hypothetical protein
VRFVQPLRQLRIAFIEIGSHHSSFLLLQAGGLRPSLRYTRKLKLRSGPVRTAWGEHLRVFYTTRALFARVRLNSRRMTCRSASRACAAARPETPFTPGPGCTHAPAT